MKRNHAPRTARTVVGGLSLVGLVVVGGCQRYERAPLDLRAYRGAMDARAANLATPGDLAQQLGESAGVPAHFDPRDGLSQPEGEVLALFFHPGLRVARAQAGVVQAQAEHAGRWSDPEFGFDGSEVVSGGGVFEYGLVLNFTLPVSGRLGVEHDRGEAAYEAALRRVEDLEWQTRMDVRRAWVDWSGVEQRRTLIAAVVGEIERLSPITDRLEEAGELTRVEARLLRSQLGEMRVAMLEAEYESARARLALLGLMGLPMDVPIELLPTMRVPQTEPTDDPIERLIAGNTALAGERAAYRVAEETLRLEIRKQYPDLTIGTGYGHESPDDKLLLGFSVPIPVFNGNRAGISAAQRERAAARARAEAAFEHLAQQLRTQQVLLASIGVQRASYEDGLVPMLDEQQREIERLAELGEVDTLLLLETLTRGFEGRTRLLELRIAELHARVELARLLGPTPTADTTHDNPIERNTTAEGDES